MPVQSSLDMSSLSIFPSEILECITGVIVASQQMRLWQCGDRILNLKLKNGGLKRTSLFWSDCTWMPWPKSYFTTYDGIVDVEWNVSIGTSLCPTLELSLLPKTLKRLHLACDDVFILLRRQNVKMNDMLPLLESLYLSGRRLREENLKNLPSNLIDLRVDSLNEKINSSCIFGDLPRSLRNLTFSFHIVDQSELENDLPSQLISLDIALLECNFNWLSKLPTSLKTLKIFCRRFVPNWLTLPPLLEELKLVGLSISKSALLQLPQSLKTLYLPKIEGLAAGDQIGPFLPKNLTQVTSTSNNIDQTGLQQLPTSLTDFDIAVSAAHPDMLSFYSPESIKIRIRGGPFSSELNIFPLPTKLQFLELDHVNDDLCALLPSGLQTLKIAEGGLITIKGASNLPMSLTSLTGWLEMFDDNETMSYLRHLSNLELKVTEDLKLTGNFNEHWLSSLLTSSPTRSNDRLTSLKVSGAGYAHTCPLIQKSFFDALSKFIHLNDLELQYLGGISSDWLSQIPQNVTNLKIGFLDTSPTETQLSRLPKCLRFLYLATGITARECDWNDEDLQSLPRSLQVFIINSSLPKLTQNMYQYLPPTLRQMHYDGNSYFPTSLDRMYGKS